MKIHKIRSLFTEINWWKCLGVVIFINYLNYNWKIHFALNFQVFYFGPNNQSFEEEKNSIEPLYELKKKHLLSLIFLSLARSWCRRGRSSSLSSSLSQVSSSFFISPGWHPPVKNSISSVSMLTFITHLIMSHSHGYESLRPRSDQIASFQIKESYW